MSDGELGDEYGLDELAEESLPPEVDQRALPIDLNQLFAWHRPRKQQVREAQWARLVKNHLAGLLRVGAIAPREIILGDGERHVEKPELRYLTLPGLDFLDVRLIGQVAGESGCELNILGFLDDAADARVLARARVRQEGLIQSGYLSSKSTTLPRKLESICYADGDTMGQVKRRAPFHVINLDACGSPAPKQAEHAQRLVDAIHKMVELQVNLSTSKWLLFLTVDVRGENMDPGTFDRLCEAIRMNAAESDEFKAGASELFGGASPDSFEDAMAAARGSESRGTLNVFALGMAKWLLHLVDKRHWTLRMKPSYCYATTGGKTNDSTMCSLAFEFIPPPPGLADPLQVSRQQPALGGPVGDPSILILQSAVAIEDLDQIFAGDDELAERMNIKTRELLLEAGYGSAALDALTPQLDQPVRFRRFPDMAQEPGG